RPAGQSLRFAGRPVDLALAPDGKTLYVKDIRGLLIVDVGPWRIRRELPFPADGGASMHGIAISRDGSRLYVTTALDLLWEAAVGNTAYVSNWAGRHPKAGELTAESNHAPVLVDNRGIVSSGTVSVVDLRAGKALLEIETGLHPSDVALSADGRTLYLANANSD